MTTLNRRRSRGFTLTELMIVVSMIGVLSALAVVGYRKYVESSKISEPMSVIQGIRSSEEEFHDKALTYLNVSQSNTFYPRASGYNSAKAAWINPSHSDINRWRTLGVSVNGPVRFSYKVNAGSAGNAISTPISYSPAPNFGNPTKDWYVVQAIGDPNENTKPTVLLATSFSGEIVYNEDQ